MSPWFCGHLKKRLHLYQTGGLVIALLCFFFAGSGCTTTNTNSSPHTGKSESDNQHELAQAILQEGLISQDSHIRTSAIETVAFTGQVNFVPAVRRLLRDPVVPVRFAALLALGDTLYRPAQADFHEILDEPQEDTNVRMAAAYALVRLGQTQYAEFYIQQISSNDQTIRANAALLVGKAGLKNALDPLYWALQNSKSNDRVLMQAAESIARLGDTRITEKLWTRLISAYADDRIDGMRAMSALGNEQARAAIMTMINDDVIEVRLAAAELMGTWGDRSGETLVLNTLQTYLKDSHPEDPAEAIRVKVLCTNAIGTIGSENLTSFLPQLMRDSAPMIKMAAARSVFLLQKPSQVRP